jgi:lysophospholipase
MIIVICFFGDDAAGMISSKSLTTVMASRNRFTARDNTELSWCSWERENVVDYRSIILILHGIGFHAEPYSILPRGIDVPDTLFAGLDFRGHGMSGGARRELPPLGVMLNDIDDWVSHMRALHPEAKLFLLAESMAGPYATLYASLNPDLLDGLVLIAPAMIPARQQIFHQRTIKEVFTSVRSPSSPGILLSSARTGATHVDGTKVISLRANDALAIQTVEPRYMLRLFYAMSRLAVKPSARINSPVLILHGSNDNILSPTGSKWLFRKIKSPHKVLEVVPHAYHTMIWDSSRDRTFHAIERWLMPHLDAQHGS